MWCAGDTETSWRLCWCSLPPLAMIWGLFQVPHCPQEHGGVHQTIKTSARNSPALCSSPGRDSRPFLPGFQSREGGIDPVWLELLGLRKQEHHGPPALQGPAGLTKTFSPRGQKGKPKRKPLSRSWGQSHPPGDLRAASTHSPGSPQAF